MIALVYETISDVDYCTLRRAGVNERVLEIKHLYFAYFRAGLFINFGAVLLIIFHRF